MTEIQLTDWLGDTWRILLPGVYRTSKQGFTELWVYVGLGPDALRNFQEIPLPVFTDWW